MLARITSALGAIKTGSDIAKEIASAQTLDGIQHRTTDLFGVMADIQQQLVSMQIAYTSLLDERDALKQEVSEMKRAMLDRQQYVLHALPLGGLVYRFRGTHDRADAAHDLCVQCYEQGTKSVLQPNGGHLICPACKLKLKAKSGASPAARRGGVCLWTL
ncbi:hypothetical protein SAMN05216570_1033 [Dyella sp. OK004]|uniref:hypothetical protein n=1 Tax=Dyella sp. OK004 TaxID=1855292 RepID=UPI0008E8B087|nr:hypothetical protein [Dyella sp. OK004]SFR94694.1 hypothetical protein SAMN05216570_1033 [Dyella sp. OK004]